jgi:6-phosphogluconate dehydrogenase (decarboxylating)
MQIGTIGLGRMGGSMVDQLFSEKRWQFGEHDEKKG